ncbi:MAG: beta-ketoacyl synthase N-terminal-like domain-containing protein [Phycisphaerales bacterium]
MRTDRRRVVITGLGLVSGHGLGHAALLGALAEGRTAIGPVDPARTRGFDADGFPCRLAACVPDLDAKAHVPKSYRKAVKVMARDTEIAVACAALAAADAGLKTRAHDPEAATYPAGRLACNIGAGLIATEIGELASAMATAATGAGAESASGSDELPSLDTRAWGSIAEVEGAKGGMDNLQPLWLLKYLPNMLACHVTIVHGAEGPSNTITCAEASGLLSIGEAARVVERGWADAAIAGGAESKVNPMGLMRWHLAGRVAECGVGDDLREVVRPFDAASRGSVLGEGGGLLILEGADTATARGAVPYAEIAGFGAAQSVPTSLPYASGETGPDATALGDAIERAMADAGLGPDAIDAVIPLALGEPEADEAEWRALSRVFGERLASIPIVTLTPSIGNCVAGHGGLGVGVAAALIRSAAIPPAAVTRGPSKTKPPRAILVCATALGGQAAAMVVAAPEPL